MPKHARTIVTVVNADDRFYRAVRDCDLILFADKSRDEYGGGRCNLRPGCVVCPSDSVIYPACVGYGVPYVASPSTRDTNGATVTVWLRSPDIGYDAIVFIPPCG